MKPLPQAVQLEVPHLLKCSPGITATTAVPWAAHVRDGDSAIHLHWHRLAVRAPWEQPLSKGRWCTEANSSHY